MNWEVRTMRSKTSFFNRTLFRKNLARFWPLWGGASFLGALTPLAMLMELIRIRFQVEITAPEMASGYYMVLTQMVPAVCLVYAVLCALAVWSYLFNARSVGLLHTLPLSRNGLFVTNALSGLAMMVIPFTVTGALCLAVSALTGTVAPAALLATVLCVLGECLFYFASATLIAFITGHGVAMAALYFIFHFLAVGIEYLLRVLASGFYFGVMADSAGVSQWLSPTIALMREFTYGEEYQDVFDARWNVYRTTLQSVHLENAWIVALYALVGAGMLALAWLLYRRRRSESAGDVVAVGWMKPVFRYGCALCAALAGGMVLYSIFWAGYQGGSRYEALPMGICMVLAGVLGYYIASMLLAKSLRIFRTTWKGAVGTAAAAAVLCGVMAGDVLSIEDRLPEAGDVESVWFTMDNGISGRLKDQEEIQKIVEAHRALLAEKEDFKANENRAYNEPNWSKAMFSVFYTMENGTSLRRSYYLDYHQDDLENPDTAMGRLAALAVEPGIQRANLLRSDIDHFTGGEIGCWKRSTKERVTISIDAEQAQALYEAMERDIEAGHFGKTTFRDQAWSQEVYNESLYFYYQTVPNAQNDYSTYSASHSVSFSVHCTELIRALEELGILDEDYQLLTHAEEEQMYGDAAWGENTSVEEDLGLMDQPVRAVTFYNAETVTAG